MTVATHDVGRRHSGHHHSITPRLLLDEARQQTLGLEAERSYGTYSRREVDLLSELEIANLRGRGGAAFPAHIKWRAVASAPGPRVVVANGEEGEPTSAKDQWLLTHRPHLVLDGLLLAAATVDANRAVVYLSHPKTARTIEHALSELHAAHLVPPGLEIDIHMVAPTYVAGEESAACRAINGGPALPTAKPPRPFEAGVDGRPTLVSNVETLAHAAWISRNGADEYRSQGTSASPGTTLVTLGGACARPGVYEVPFGLTVAQLFDDLAGGFTSAPSGFVMGGWFGGLLSADHADLSCTYEAVRETGSGLGCASITALGADENPVAVAARIAAWYARESADQCGVCIKGTASIRDALADLQCDRATPQTRNNLERWGASLPGRGACAFLDGAATLARSVVEQFPPHIGHHPKESAS